MLTNPVASTLESLTCEACAGEGFGVGDRADSWGGHDDDVVECPGCDGSGSARCAGVVMQPDRYRRCGELATVIFDGDTYCASCANELREED